MYSPSHYKEDRPELLFEIIQNFEFATIITQDENGPFVSHLPLLLEDYEGKPTLLGHCARANPQWKHFAAGQKLTAIFHGPHSYISPAWYEPKPDNVPTWNYLAVQVRGHARIFDEPVTSYEVLQKIVKRFEDQYETEWQLAPAPNEGLNMLLRSIVAFRIEIENVQGKFKLSQKQSAKDRNTVIENLPRYGENHERLASYMRKVMVK